MDLPSTALQKSQYPTKCYKDHLEVSLHFGQSFVLCPSLGIFYAYSHIINTVASAQREVCTFLEGNLYNLGTGLSSLFRVSPLDQT